MIRRNLAKVFVGVRMFIATWWENMEKLECIINALDSGRTFHPYLNSASPRRKFTTDEIHSLSKWVDPLEEDLTKNHYKYLKVTKELTKDALVKKRYH